MGILDMRTVLISYLASNFLCSIMMGVLWARNKRRFKGLGLWFADFALQTLGLALVAGRGILPNILSMPLAVTLLILGTVLLLEGLARFHGRSWPRIQNILIVVMTFGASAFFTFARPSLQARNLLFSAALLAVCAQAAWFLLAGIPRESRAWSGWTALALLVVCAISAARIPVEALQRLGQDFFGSPPHEVLFILGYQVSFILLLVSLFFMVNGRLIHDLEADKRALKDAQEATRHSEEKFAKAFEASPIAILISRIGGGGVIDVNERLIRLSGYSREEILANGFSVERFLAKPSDGALIREALDAGKRVRDLELEFRTKSGRRLNCLYSCERITINGQPHLLSLVRDEAERRRSDQIIKTRLRLWEYAADHTFPELMQKALDEIEELTGSCIGFYHFVDEEAGSLSLQAWSTRTEREFCRAEGKGMQYAISEAGVWVDCIRARAPVVHNDYDSLPGKRGLPPGHARIIREAVVPTFRGGKIVAILGVGNKPEPYSQQDIDLVAYIADLVWAIVEQKRADQRIYELNARLEVLAMTDELTGLANRRAFFAQGARELSRARRRGAPISALMLDLDRFKDVNDKYGHEAGDAALRALAEVLREGVRQIDQAARLGGEEFAILLPDTGIQAALILAERLRSAVEAVSVSTNGISFGITVSVGAAQAESWTVSLDELLHASDQAMYRAKEAGRNAVRA
jgi:diguanylate cyclase (GGDEF)-like protein/PAS domain S-box-containing protein